jgi:hypothetical protein
LVLQRKEFLGESAKALYQKLAHVGQAEKKVRNAFRIAWWIAVSRRMILLPVAQDAMAVATYRDPRLIVFVEVAARDVMELKNQRFVDATKRASRRVRTQSLQRPLLAALTLQFLIVHVQGPSDDDAVDVLKALVVR